MNGNAPYFSMGGPSTTGSNMPYQAPTAPMMADNFDFSDADFANFTSGSDDASYNPSNFTNSGGTSTPLDFGDPNQFNNVDNLFGSPAPPMPSGVMPMMPQQPMPMMRPAAIPGTMVPMHLRQPQGPPGMAYHPAVGWHYPVQPLMPPPQFQAPQQPAFMGGQILPPQSKKRKQSPPAVTIPDTLDISDDDDDDGEFQPSKRARRRRPTPPRSNKQPIVTPTTASSGRKVPSIDQICVCASRIQKVPRPQNAFILYRRAMIKNISRNAGRRGKAPVTDQSHISKSAGEAWRNESEEVKAKFKRLADEAAEQHKLMYPGYKYKPTRKGKSGGGMAADQDLRFGTPECECGAYAANVRKLKAAGFDVEGTDAVPTEAVATAFAAPPDPMGYQPVIAQQQPMGYHDISAEQTARNRELATRFGKPPFVAAVAAPTRRSSRQQNSINYAESANDFNTDDLEAQLQAELSKSPVQTRASLSQRRQSSVAPIQTPFSTGPAQNTRSKSVTPETFVLPENDHTDWGELLGENTDVNAPLEEFDFDAFVAENAAANGSRRRSSARMASRRSSKRSPPPPGMARRSSPRTSPRAPGSVEKHRSSIITRSQRSSSGGKRSPRQASPK